MRIGTLWLLSAAAAFLLSSGVNVSAEDVKRNEGANVEKEYPPTNSGINLRDRSERRVTADDQSFTESDVELASRIRASLMREDELSVLAQNIKVITQRGQVTLRGPVKNIEEKEIVARKAGEIAGFDKVKNELEIEKNKNTGATDEHEK